MSDDTPIALVIGGSRGIGRAIVETLAARKFEVVFTYGRDAGAAEQVRMAVAASGGAARALRCDLSRISDLAAVMEQVDAEDGALRVVVNNGAIWEPEPLATLEEAGFTRTIDINLKGPIFLAKLAAPRLPRGGRIILVSSIAARLASPDYLVYAASKAGLNSVARGLAVLLGPQGITVNVVSPGLTDTDMTAKLGRDGPPEAIAGAIAMTALGRMGQPADIAGAVALLASPDADWITGQVIECTGGLML